MSDSKNSQNRIGFSTGALERQDYVRALKWLRNHEVNNDELSTLRYNELEPLVEDLDHLKADDFFSYISFHAPSAFPEAAERHVVNLLKRVAKRGWNIVVHPDVIHDFSLWRPFGNQLLLENMDR